MYYNINTQAFIYENVLMVKGDESTSDMPTYDTYLLDNLDNNQLKELGIARVIEEYPTLSDEDSLYQKLEDISEYNEETGIYNKGQRIVNKTLQEVKEALIIYNKNKFAAKLDALTENLSPQETLTWQIQLSEAKAFKETQDENNARNIAIIANSRNIPLNVLVEKILEKNTLYTTASFTLISERQKREDLINQAKSIKALKALNIESDFNLN